MKTGLFPLGGVGGGATAVGVCVIRVAGALLPEQAPIMENSKLESARCRNIRGEDDMSIFQLWLRRDKLEAYTTYRPNPNQMLSAQIGLIDIKCDR